MDSLPDPAIITFMASWGLAFLTLTYLAMMLAEMYLYRRLRPGQYDYENAFGSFSANLMSSIGELLLFTVIPFAAYLFIYSQARLFDPGFAAWTWIAAFVIHETCYHFGHVIGHRTGLGWAFHQPHHSSEELNLSTSARGTLFGDPVARTFMLSGALIGIHPLVFLTVMTFKNFWGIFNHTRLVDKMGPLERVMATPANHRVHHGRNPRYIDKNYGQVLVLWDRLLGTFEPETEASDFGLVKPMTSNNPWKIWTSGFAWLGARIASAPDWKTRLKYLYMPPEWSHTGCTDGCASARFVPQNEAVMAAE